MLDFSSRPPEINAGLFYAGLGPDSLEQAQWAWERLADELNEKADEIADKLVMLLEGWWGAGANAMSDAAAPYVKWLRNTAALAEQTAQAAELVTDAYDATDLAMVSLDDIAVNIAWKKQLRLTNQFGQNAPKIVAAENQYLDYWHMNAMAMRDYQRDVADAMQGVQPFAGLSNAIGVVPADELSGSPAQG